MGRAKALLPWAGRPLVSHIVASLRQVVDEVVVVSSREIELPALDAVVVNDREPGLGPLGGIREGLHAIGSDFALIVSVDAPLLSATFARTLIRCGRTSACVVDGRLQPFPALYEKRLAATADRLIESGRMRPPFLLEAAGYHQLDHSLVDRDAFQGFNTAEEYDELLSKRGNTAP